MPGRVRKGFGMQEIFALGAIVLSLLSYVLVAVGPSGQSTASPEMRPLAVLESDSTIFATASLFDFEPERKLKHMPAQGWAATAPWPPVASPRAKGRVAFGWVAHAPDERLATNPRWTRQASPAAQAGDAAAIEEPQVLKRFDGRPASPVDPLSDDVLHRYRQYAGELAELREVKRQQVA